MAEATHAYVGIYQGECKAVHVDLGDDHTVEFIAEVIRHGGHVERVPLDVARTALFQPWPLAEQPSP